MGNRFRFNNRRWVDLELSLLAGYHVYWEGKTRATWLLKFNFELCLVIITFYGHVGLPYRPPVFNPWYVKMCHRYYRWRGYNNEKNKCS